MAKNQSGTSKYPDITDGADVTGRKMPCSVLAEQSLLGSILIDPEVFPQITGLVSSQDFFIEQHGHIFTAMLELFNANRNIDIVTLVDMLVERGFYNRSGGENYIRDLLNAVPDALNTKDYAKIVKEKSILRQLIQICGDITETAYSEQDSVANILDAAESSIYSISRGKDVKNFATIQELIIKVYDNLHTMQQNPEAAKGTDTGFGDLDRVLAGMGKSDLILVGARPGMGKTSFCLNIGCNVALKTGKTVCIFSLEMSGEQLVNRLISSEAMVDSYALRTGELSYDDWQGIAAATSKLNRAKILVDDTSGISVAGMKAKLRRVENLGLVIVDYLQLMQADKKTDNRVQEVGDISRNLKIMAKELMVPVICCAQLSRAPESRDSKRPQLSDLRDSGAIEQDADVVMFLFRDEYYKIDDKENGSQDSPAVAEVIVAKNRHGSTKTVKLGWIGRYTKFRSLAGQETP